MSPKVAETSKQVRVDNWGIYFLQRLQLFFSKTDYCDLTLQFEGNVQLKVHRLVMNACTEYFAFLEQTCPAMEENTIMMPTDLQADVIVPIVNFMYTGMLEYHPSIFDKLYRAAETMNIAVLTKLLEAKLNSPVAPAKIAKPKRSEVAQWGTQKKTAKVPQASPVAQDLLSPTPGRKVPLWKRKQIPTVTHAPTSTFAATKWISEPPEKDPISIVDNAPKPTRFEWPDEELPLPSTMDASFDDISLTSKPLWTKDDDSKAGIIHFEDSNSLTHSPQSVSKNNSISQEFEEEFPKEQKVNVSQLEEQLQASGVSILKRKADSQVTTSPKRAKVSEQEEETVISIKTNNPAEIDHTKIVSEILKKYPDLVKKKKNIKLKIIPVKSNEPPSIKVQTFREKVKPPAGSPVTEKSAVIQLKKEIKMEPQTPKETSKESIISKNRNSKKNFQYKSATDEGPWTCLECYGDGEAPEFVLYYLFRKHMTDVHHMKFDNTLCKYCGKKCSTDVAMAYHMYTKHGLKPPKDIDFPKCENCPFIAVSKEKLEEHLSTHGKDEAQCKTCKLGFLTAIDLRAHLSITGHNNRNAQHLLDCAYCMKKLQSPVSLFTHIRSQHMKEARRDKITSLNEIMDVVETDADATQNVEVDDPTPTPVKTVKRSITIEDKNQQLQKDKVKILSNVKVATIPGENGSENTDSTVEQPVTEPVTVATTTLTNLGGSLATNLGLVDIVVLDDNQQYILQQPQGQEGNAEFILPELAANEGILQAATAADINSTDELVMVLTDHDYQDEQSQDQGDNSNIVVLYSHPVEGQQGQFITSQGNLLVNSEGMLEIRNGAGITTTAGQIFVNSDNTTTTQAVDSPIESIELIRKEIEDNHNGIHVEKEIPKELSNEGESSLLMKVNEIKNEKTENAEIVSEKEKPETVQADEPLDATDSTVQEEPMEVDEIEDQEKEVTQEEKREDEENIQSTEAEKHPSSEVVTPVIETDQEEKGVDVPPDESHEIEKPADTSADSKKENQSVIADPIEGGHEVEPMEVDGGKITEVTKNNTAQDEVDNLQTVTDTASDSTNIPQKLSPQDLHSENELYQTSDNQETNPKFPEDQDQEDPSVIPEMIQNSEYTDKNENPDSSNKTEVSEQPEILEQTDNGHINDQNNSLPFDDFTDDSQQSSTQRLHKDLNKEILDDWDDTDSQQSQKSQSKEESESGPEQDNVLTEAAQNVNKLMDDWDEEDEDQSKD